MPRHAFSPAGLPLDFQWLRTPEPERIFSLAQRPGWLRLVARESIGSWFEQALVARRQQHFVYRAETELDFQPRTYQQAAGLTAYYNRYKFHCLAVTSDETSGRALTVMSCEGDDPDARLSFPLAEPIAIGTGSTVRLAISVDHAELRFAYALDAGRWRDVGPILDASILSDEAGGGEHRSFTGAFVGLFAFDTSGAGIAADFRYFEYDGSPA
jgi:xylan 1,4-beta-xylosidase